MRQRAENLALSKLGVVLRSIHGILPIEDY
jgi:hypothetical protein